MASKCRRKGATSFKTTVVLAVFVSPLLFCQIVSADDRSHYEAARQLVDIAFDYQAMCSIAIKAASDTAKEKLESDPNTMKYSNVLLAVVVEVAEAALRDVQTENKTKMAITEIYMDEFSEYDLRELGKFYKTPLGRKVLQKVPVLTQKGMERGGSIGIQVLSSPKYAKMASDKIEALKKKGVLPTDFK